MINVLLASYKGQAFLPAQILSIMRQENVDVRLNISDDESADSLYQFLNNDSICLPYLNNVTIMNGPKNGVNANFLRLIHNASVQKNSLYAFADQDDIWLSRKLDSAQRHLNALVDNDDEQVALYMGRTMVCDVQLNPLFLSKGMVGSASFKNALLESAAGGNTMVFNAPMLQLLQKINYPVHHDWLAYMVITSCGGHVIFDDTPYVLYRQHDNNVIGANKGVKAKLLRFKKILSNEFRAWADNNIKALSPLFSQMTAENQVVYIGFKHLHEMQGWYYCFHRLVLFQKLGLYRQRKLEHLGFMLAAFLGKI